MELLELLVTRTSCGKLQAPAPTGNALRHIIQAGLRAPDHGRLRPWRFLIIEGDGLDRLGQLFAEAASRRTGDRDEAALIKFRQQPLRAPLIIAVIASPKSHAKIPEIEQYHAVACAAYAMLLAANAQGFNGIWRTGDNAYDAYINQQLGLEPHEQIIAYLYLGTAAGEANPLPLVDPDSFISRF
jgi:nitroreductase